MWLRLATDTLLSSSVSGSFYSRWGREEGKGGGEGFMAVIGQCPPTSMPTTTPEVPVKRTMLPCESCAIVGLSSPVPSAGLRTRITPNIHTYIPPKVYRRTYVRMHYRPPLHSTSCSSASALFATAHTPLSVPHAGSYYHMHTHMYVRTMYVHTSNYHTTPSTLAELIPLLSPFSSTGTLLSLSPSV